MQRRRIKGNGTTAADEVGGNKEINLSARVCRNCIIYINIILYTVGRCEIASGIDLYNYLIIILEKMKAGLGIIL